MSNFHSVANVGNENGLLDQVAIYTDLSFKKVAIGYRKLGSSMNYEILTCPVINFISISIHQF